MDLAASVAHRLPARHDLHHVFLGAGWLAAIAATVAAAEIAASGPASNPTAVAAARAAIVATPLAVGLYTWSRRPGDRFARVLVAVGAVSFVTTLAESGNSAAYTTGRAAGWLVEVLLVCLILSFPTGRLRERADRRLALAMALVVLLLFLPRLALAADFEVPSPFTSCSADCPPNALFELDGEPGLVDAVLRPLGAVGVFVVMAAVLARLWQRVRGASALARRILIPVLTIGAAHAGLLAVGFAIRQVDPEAPFLDAVAWVLAFVVPALAVTFLVGVVRWQIFTSAALRHLAQLLPAASDTRTLRRALAEAFADPTTEIVFPVSGRAGSWANADGQPVERPADGSGLVISELRHRGEVVAAVVHDEALAYDTGALEAGLGIAGVALENQRLAADAEVAAREAGLSRARIAASAERERRRIERDLHDGAQQRLVALRIELELAEELVRRDPALGIGRLRELEGEVDEALEELRSLAHGIYPPLLADRGLVEMLRSVAVRFTIPLDVGARGVERYEPEIESAVYFCIVEALQNVLKHAPTAHRVWVRLDGRPGVDVRFRVRDDGSGTADGTVVAGAGMTNMRDRLAAVGGDVTVSSTPGVGTTVRGWVPTPESVSA
jgi:signal transduction histidine kinase